MAGKPRILFVCDSRDHVEQVLGSASDNYEAVVVENPMRALAHLTREVIIKNRPVKEEVISFRQRFLFMKYCFSTSACEKRIQKLHSLV